MDYRESILGNTHNIPCVRFSPCEKYLGSASIDKVVRVFAVESASLVTSVAMPGWAWGIDWVGRAECALHEYQLVVSLAKELFLMRVAKKGQTYAIEKVASQTNNSHSSIGNHCRYSIVRYLAEKNLILASTRIIHHSIIVGQHTPDVHFFRLFKDKKDEVRWEFQSVFNLPPETYIIGAHLGQLSDHSSYVILASLQGNVYIHEVRDEQDSDHLLHEVFI